MFPNYSNRIYSYLEKKLSINKIVMKANIPIITLFLQLLLYPVINSKTRINMKMIFIIDMELLIM
jgi:hypothetical protein